MPTLNEIRAHITDEQRAVINAIWEYHVERNERWAWIPVAVLYRKFTDLTTSRKSGREFVLSALSSLSGSIVYEHEDHYYGLTALGILLTDDGQDGIDLLARCLELFQSKHDSGHDLKEIHISSQEIATSLNLSEDKLRMLYELIQLSPSASAGGSREEWTMSVTYWRDEFLSEDDLRTYIEEEILTGYDPDLPIERHERSRYLYEKQSKVFPSGFSFIHNDDLRELLESDWKEVQAVYAVKAWKSCLILCGSILEGVLFDILSRDEKRSLTAYAALGAGRPAKSVSDLNLASLVDVANELKILQPGAFHLSHALRHSRNLVHPEKLLREKVEVTEEDAHISVSSVKVFLRIAATI
jgi:hypothetical protein